MKSLVASLLRFVIYIYFMSMRQAILQTHWDGQQQKTRRTKTLLLNMVYCEGLGCRDARDRIYALQAISSDVKELDIDSDSSCNSASQLFLKVSIRL